MSILKSISLYKQLALFHTNAWKHGVHYCLQKKPIQKEYDQAQESGTKVEPKVRGQCVDRNNRIKTEDMKFQLFSVHLAVVKLQELFQLSVTITAYTAQSQSVLLSKEQHYILYNYAGAYKKHRTIRILPFRNFVFFFSF